MTTVPPNPSRPIATTQDNPARTLPGHTYSAVERLHAIPGVVGVICAKHFAIAYVTYAVYKRAFIEVAGDTPGDALNNLELAVRDAYMAVS